MGHTTTMKAAINVQANARMTQNVKPAYVRSSIVEIVSNFNVYEGQANGLTLDQIFGMTIMQGIKTQNLMPTVSIPIYGADIRDSHPEQPNCHPDRFDEVPIQLLIRYIVLHMYSVSLLQANFAHCRTVGFLFLGHRSVVS